MKLITFNIRGLGGVKKRELKDLVRQQKPDMLCIQETKMEGVDGRLSSMLWGATILIGWPRMLLRDQEG